LWVQARLIQKDCLQMPLQNEKNISEFVCCDVYYCPVIN
jgi:hypothetical protein